MMRHRILNFVDDCSSSRLNTKHLFHLYNVVGDGMLSHYAWCNHDLLETISFNKELLITLLTPRIIFFFDVDDSPVNGWNTLTTSQSNSLQSDVVTDLDNHSW